MTDIAISVQNLSKCYQIYDNPRDRLKQFVMPRMHRIAGNKPRQYFREFWALKDVSFEIKKGETVGIIGRNGSGKSTLLQMICGTLNPTSGSVQTNGRIAALLELGSGFNPEFTGRENVYLNAAVLGLSKEEIDARFESITTFADIGQFIEQPVKSYSSGMTVRLAFAISINIKPSILIIDEALAVGDAAFQRKCLRKIEELSLDGVTIIFVSHDTETVKKLCDRAIYLKNGCINGIGVTKEVCQLYESDLFGASSVMEVSKDNQYKLLSDNNAVGSKLLIDLDLQNSNEKVYGDGRAIISNIKLTNTNLEKVNLIYEKNTFIVSYKVSFKQKVVNPIFGMMIANREGMCIFGVNTSNKLELQSTYDSIDELNISFTLSNNLGPGIYYLTCGVHSTDNADGLVYLHRRMDVMIFKSISNCEDLICGVSQLNHKIDFLRFKNNNE